LLKLLPKNSENEVNYQFLKILARLRLNTKISNWNLSVREKNTYTHDSRKPVVENGTLEDDLKRRDFTINTLAICLNGNRFGELLDYFDGLSDIENLIIRTPLDPDITFSDDPLRMMRAIRFASQLGFDIYPDTFDAITKNKDRISIISGERIAEELNKIMLSPKPSIGFILLEKTGLLDIIFRN